MTCSHIFSWGWQEQFICFPIRLVVVNCCFLLISQVETIRAFNWKTLYTKVSSSTNLSSISQMTGVSPAECASGTFSSLPLWLSFGENLFSNSLAKSVSPASSEASINFRIVLPLFSENAVSRLSVGLRTPLPRHCLHRSFNPSFSPTFNQ